VEVTWAMVLENPVSRMTKGPQDKDREGPRLSPWKRALGDSHIHESHEPGQLTAHVIPNGLWHKTRCTWSGEVLQSQRRGSTGKVSLSTVPQQDIENILPASLLFVYKLLLCGQITLNKFFKDSHYVLA
jgi:hypothetical protein